MKKDSQFFNKISDPQNFVRLWKANKEKQSTLKIGFAQFSGGISIRDMSVLVASPGVQNTPLFQHEELKDNQLEASRESGE